MGGFFKVYRDIFQHEIFKHELDFRLFMLILGNAMYDKNGATIEGIHVKRGQWIRSYRNLMKDLEYKQGRGYKQHGIGTIKRAVERLVKNELVTVSETECGTLFTVVNYEKYQGVSQTEKENAEQLAEHNEQNIDLGIDKRNGIRNGMRNTINSPESPEIPSDFTNGRCESGTVSGTVSGTLAEQKKESKKDKKLINNNPADDPFPDPFEIELTEEQKLEVEIEEYYQIRRLKIGPVSPKDRDLIKQAIYEEKFTREEIISGINEAVSIKGPNGINSFEYCLKVMRTQRKEREKWNQMKKERERQQHATRPEVSKHSGSAGGHSRNTSLDARIKEQQERRLKELEAKYGV